MRLREDRTALETIPLRLMIIAVVASMSVVPAAQALDGLENREFMRRADLQLERIISTAQLLAIAGPGNVRTIDLDFGGDGSVRFESVVIGDRQGGANISSAILRLSTGALKVHTATDPPVWMMAETGTGLVLTMPLTKLRMSAVFENRACFVLLEVV